MHPHRGICELTYSVQVRGMAAIATPYKNCGLVSQRIHKQDFCKSINKGYSKYPLLKEEEEPNPTLGDVPPEPKGMNPFALFMI